MSPEKRYAILRVGLFFSVSLLALLIPVMAASIASQTTTGHIRIVNGTNAGILVTPSFLDYGNVTWGTTITKGITVQNTGSCIENVTATASQPGQPVVMAFIPSLSPGHQMIVNATYDTRVFAVPGDYSFSIDWTAKCL